MAIHGSKPVALFGCMHLIAANIWTWLRFVMKEEQQTQADVYEIYQHDNRTNTGQMEQLKSIQDQDYGSGNDYYYDGGTSTVSPTSAIAVNNRCSTTHCIFGNFDEIMYTVDR